MSYVGRKATGAVVVGDNAGIKSIPYGTSGQFLSSRGDMNSPVWAAAPGGGGGGSFVYNYKEQMVPAATMGNLVITDLDRTGNPAPNFYYVLAPDSTGITAGSTGVRLPSTATLSVGAVIMVYIAKHSVGRIYPQPGGKLGTQDFFKTPPSSVANFRFGVQSTTEEKWLYLF